MFGTNPIRPDEQALDGQTLAVQEIFYTLQGEGPQAGRPAVFIRLAGCNLACSFCDTDFESKIENRLSVEQIIAQVEAFPHHGLVVLTGGEPLRQNISVLVDLLIHRGVVDLVQIETAGTLWDDRLDQLALYPAAGPFLQIVCSPKTPRLASFVAANCRHFKYVIEAGRVLKIDGLPGYGTQLATKSLPQKLFRPGRGATIWVSPCDPGEGNGANGKTSAQIWKANTDEAVRSALLHGYRLSLQMHKLVGLP